MSEVAIKAEGLGKRYRIGARQRGYDTARDALTRGMVEALQWTSGILQRHRAAPVPDREFWALTDVSFSVPEGEIVGVVGSNGAGKSTLLKILSRITEPSTGRAVVRGRVASLLEVGTGFHPELTGRENILLNGIILGMRRADVRRHFDEIVEFADVGPFIDTPVKRYSSGMYLRLAFAVAAHLTPEVLLVDEVLAVGDANFQKKCLGRMSEVARDGRTVLFVSHNMAAVQSLCSRVVWLRRGRVAQVGEAGSVVSAYISESVVEANDRVWSDVSTAPGGDSFRLHRARVRRTGHPGTDDRLSVRTPFAIEVEYWNLRDGNRLALSVNLYTELGVLIFSAGLPQEEVYGGAPMPVGLFRDRCEVPGDLLNDGMHRVELYVMCGNAVVHHEPDLLSFSVADSDYLRGSWYGKWPGAIRPKLAWTTELLETLPGARL